MGKYKIIAVAGFLVLLGLFSAGAVSAADNNMRSGQVVSVGRDEIVDSSLFMAGSTLTIAGTVRGDVYCAGQTIDITGTVEGDVLCAGQTIQISGRVDGNVRVAGQTVNIGGPVSRSVTAFGQTVSVTDNATVDRDVLAFGSSVMLAGLVSRDVTGGGQTVVVSGTVGRHSTLFADQVTVASTGRLGGDLTYTSNKEAQVESGGMIAGRSERKDPPKEAGMGDQQDSWADRLWGSLYWFGALLIFGLTMLWLLPRSFPASDAVLMKKSGWALLTGLVTLVLTPIVCVLLFVSLIGIPLGLVLLGVWLTALLLASFVYSSHAIGSWTISQFKWKPGWPRVAALALGLAILALFMLVPWIGGFVVFLALLWGLGGIVLIARDHLQKRTVAQKAKA